MFMDLWDKENTAIIINKFDKNLLADNETIYKEAISKCNKNYGVKVDGYRFEFKNSFEYGFNQTLHFSLLYDCFAFLISDTFCYLYESEDIDYIKITSSYGKEVIFKFDYIRSIAGNR
jgi:hypothetical protein